MVNVVGSKDDYSRWKPEGFENYSTLAEVCRVVNRDHSRIMQLERQAKAGKIIFPIPVRVKAGRLKVRLYSPEEVQTIVAWFEAAKPGPRAA